MSATACLVIWPDGPPSTSMMDHIYQVVYFLITYLLPLLGLSITYTYLGRVLWRMQWSRISLAEEDRRTMRVKKDMRKVKMSSITARKFNNYNPVQIARMFVVILILFCVCWFPYHAYFIVSYYDQVCPT